MKLRDEFEEVPVKHIDQDHNEGSDELARIASDKKSSQLWTLIQETLLKPSIH